MPANFKSAANPSIYANFRVYLGLRDGAAAEALALRRRIRILRLGARQHGNAPLMSDEPHEQVEPDELEEQDAELLPDREAMSIITPGYEQPVPPEFLDPLPPA